MWADQDDVRDPRSSRRRRRCSRPTKGRSSATPTPGSSTVRSITSCTSTRSTTSTGTRTCCAATGASCAPTRTRRSTGSSTRARSLNTSRWRPDVGSSNSLLFELLLQGSFRQVPETLYYYSAKGARPSPEEELRRSNGERAVVETLRRPFVTLALNQAKGVLHSDLWRWQKAALLAELGNHLALVNGAKATFRTVEALRGKRVTGWFERACALAVHDEGHPPRHLVKR